MVCHQLPDWLSIPQHQTLQLNVLIDEETVLNAFVYEQLEKKRITTRGIR
jgi:hypothetical protein